MTVDEAKEVCRSGGRVKYGEGEYTVGYIMTFYDQKERGFRNSLYLIPCNGANSVTVARLKECDI